MAKHNKKSTYKNLSKAYKKSSQNTRGGYEVDVLDETQAIVRGGFYEPKSAVVQSPILAQAQLRFCDLTGFYAQHVAFRQVGEYEFIVPIQEIHSSLPDSPIAPNPFAISRTFQGGVTHFCYEGAHPLHLLLTGNLKLYVRLSDYAPEHVRLAGKTPTLPPNLILYVCTSARPRADNTLGYQIAMDSAWQPRTLFKLNAHARYRIPMPSYEDLSKLLRRVEPKNTQIIQGSIAEGSTNSRANPQKLGYAMTSWFSIEGESHLWVKTHGCSNICRVQWKDEFGRVYYDNQLKNVHDANGVITIPPYAVAGRIYFNRGEIQQKKPATHIQIKAIPKKLDPYFGYWAEYNFFVNTLSYFNPNTEYYFVLKATEGEAWQLDQDGFICVQGGLNFQFNVRDELQSTFDQLKE
mgnify:FL=1